jgi:hypothetical protein
MSPVSGIPVLATGGRWFVPVASTIRTIATAITNVVLCRPGGTYRPEIIRSLASHKRDCSDDGCRKNTGNEPQRC